jgi:protein phosphatase
VEPVPAYEPVRYAALTDVGVKRSHNQDNFGAQPAADPQAWTSGGHVFVVADGMGGHAVGEKASEKAARDIPFIYLKHARDGVIPALRRAFQETNAGIYTVGQQNPEFRGMGTTSTALILRPEGAWFGHVGDSRAYRVRDGVCEQLTFDHSWVWEIARRQGVDPDELGDFKKNVIIRSLGPDPEVEVDIEGPHPVQPGDAFLLCSDGLTNVVPPEEIGAVVAVLPPDDATRFLINLANVRGGPDNITVLIVRVGEASPEQSPLRSNRAAGLGRALQTWNKMVPWPYTLLGAGCLLAVVSLLLHTSEVALSVPLFVLSALVIVGGLVGLVLHLKKEPPPAETADDGPRPLNVYRKHECRVSKELVDRFTDLERSLAAAVRAQSVPFDWPAHQKLTAEAEAELKKGEGCTAFRARCLSLLFLADAFNKSRPKGEGFRPNFNSP